MLRLPNGSVWLNEGEVIPVTCVCGHLYQPGTGSDRSLCPRCRRLNVHADQPRFEAVSMQADD